MPAESAEVHPALPTPVVQDEELMEIFYAPLYESLKAEMAQPPADKRAWYSLGRRGREVAELANLTAIRTVNPHLKDLAAKWPSLAAGSHRAGLELAAAAEAKDWPKAQAAYRSVIANCNACHEARSAASPFTLIDVQHLDP